MWVWAGNQNDSVFIFYVAVAASMIAWLVFWAAFVLFIYVGYPIISGLMVIVPLALGGRHAGRKYLAATEGE
jgi:hypothetical protein